MDFFVNFRNIENCKKGKKAIKQINWDTSESFFTEIRIVNETPNPNSVSVEIDEMGYFDILDVYRRVMKVLKKKVKENNSTMATDKLEWIIKNSSDAKEIRMAKEELFNLGQSKQIQNLSTVFQKRAKKIIEQYSKSCEDSMKLIFDQRELYINSDKRAEQKEILETFLSICQEYVSIKTSNKNHILKYCCKGAKIISDGTSSYCENCHTTFTDIDHSGTFNDQKRISTNSKPKYYNIKHFVSAIKKSQGIHKKTIDPIVYTKIDDYLDHHNIKLEDFNIFQLMDLLQRDSSLSSYYKDIHLIYRQKTGKQINNLSNIERDLPKLYKEQDQLSDAIKLKKSSKNSINAYYMVCRISQVHGRIDLRIKNFFCAKDEKTVEDYDKCFEKRCKVLGWIDKDQKLADFCK